MLLMRPLSTTGLLVGTLFFALSLTPSLLPRPEGIQGLISGTALAIGYGTGVFLLWLWTWSGLPLPGKGLRKRLKFLAGVIILLLAVLFLWQSGNWQNELRELMEMEAAARVRPVRIGVITSSLFLGILFLTRLFLFTKRAVNERLQTRIPPRISYLAGLLSAFLLFWLVINGILFSQLIRLADASYSQVDALLDDHTVKPAYPMKPGSPHSLLRWEEMGREGRRFLSELPSAEQIGRFTDRPVKEPLRVYGGLRSSRDPSERASLILRELIRLDAFDRSVLVLVTPTGTGWIDPGAIETLEYLHRGDVATAAAQYSYLPSALSLLVEDGYGAEMALSLFRSVYRYWTGLPAENRPRLYLFGLSLGALNSSLSFDFFDIINDPFHGVLWAGPPFRMEAWQEITRSRDSGSPAWLPRFRNGSVVRFANQQSGWDTGTAWGSFRIAFLQHASDPITFFDPRSLTREPEWMKEPRGPDVSGNFRWVPVVTMLQLAADMLTGTAVPDGYGHEFAAREYFDAWLALTEPEGWKSEELERLRQMFGGKEL